MENSLKIGDRVRVIGLYNVPVMIVNSIIDNSSVECIWYISQTCEFKNMVFHTKILRLEVEKSDK
jgi:uncharacterized protein YodC (DUF2158 family)